MGFAPNLRLRLEHAGWLPASKLSLLAAYVLGLDFLLFALQSLASRFSWKFGQHLGGWVIFLSLLASALLVALAVRWLKVKLLWRLRNRLAVTYVFIGVVPVVLVIALATGAFYLFAGQFATYIVTSELHAELRSLEAANSAIAHQLSARLWTGEANEAAMIERLRARDKSWTGRQLCVWRNGKPLLNSRPESSNQDSLVAPPFVKESFQNIVRERRSLFLRAITVVPVKDGSLTVLSSEPLDQRMLQRLASDLGEITLFSKPDEDIVHREITHPAYDLNQNETPDIGTKTLNPTYTAGSVPDAARFFDPTVPIPTSISVVDWRDGKEVNPAALVVQTRVSKLYERLFGALGQFAPPIEAFLLILTIVLALIEIIALLVGTYLTRTITSAVAQLYDATMHINRGDFSHRIEITSNDQLASLASSFNSMTASIEELIEEQKQKQRLENELVIAQEVQAQLFPKKVSQLPSLEVHGFCRPARTVSGDYYDFLCIGSDQMVLAVGDVSGKGISAALLMATIHSAVRAYSTENAASLRQLAAVEAGGSAFTWKKEAQISSDLSPAALLSLLNHQLFESTPPEKYATLFLGLYEAPTRKLTYSNGGHLPPIVLGENGSIQRLDCGGTVVGLFDHRSYDESSVQLRKGDIFLAYSDGVTEPENDFGEFGEDRLVEIVSQNRHLPLARITEVATAAVDDWIGDNEQPDDVTLVLARAR